MKLQVAIQHKIFYISVSTHVESLPILEMKDWLESPANNKGDSSLSQVD